jgi:hypothetical protein
MAGGAAPNSACPQTGQIVDLDPKGDGFLSVRSGPGGMPYTEIDRLYNGMQVYLCDQRAPWWGVVYVSGNLGECNVTRAWPTRQPYTGPCRYGWINSRYVQATQSVTNSAPQGDGSVGAQTPPARRSPVWDAGPAIGVRRVTHRALRQAGITLGTILSQRHGGEAGQDSHPPTGRPGVTASAVWPLSATGSSHGSAIGQSRSPRWRDRQTGPGRCCSTPMGGSPIASSCMTGQPKRAAAARYHSIPICAAVYSNSSNKPASRARLSVRSAADDAVCVQAVSSIGFGDSIVNSGSTAARRTPAGALSLPTRRAWCPKSAAAWPTCSSSPVIARSSKPKPTSTPALGRSGGWST